MFQFRVIYLEPEGTIGSATNRLNSLPWEPSKINSNLIEVLGRNGTGKTTLLNIFAVH